MTTTRRIPKKVKTKKSKSARGVTVEKASKRVDTVEKRIGEADDCEEAQPVEKSKRGGSHPPHPRCPECGKAMYKTMVKGASVKKSEPWAYCRNESCSKYGVDQSGVIDQTALPVKVKAPAGPQEEIDPTDEASAKMVKSAKENNANKAKKKDVVGTQGGTEVLPRKKKKKKKSERGTKRDAIRADLETGEYTISKIAQRNDCSRKMVNSVKIEMKEGAE